MQVSDFGGPDQEKWRPPSAPLQWEGGPAIPSPAAPKQPRLWRTWQLLTVGVVMLLVGVGAGAAGSGDEDDVEAAVAENSTTTSVEVETTTTETARPTTTQTPRTTTTEVVDPGTRENPFALGAPFETDEGLAIIVNFVDFNAGEAIAAENPFNEPPPAGSRFALVNLTLTNGTDENIHSSFAVSVGMVGSANREYDASNAYCQAVIPTPMFDGGELFPGGSFTGNICLVVPEAEVADGSLLLTVAAMFEDPAFVRTA